MKILSAFFLILMFALSGCGGSSSGADSNADTSEYLRVSLTSRASTSPVDIEKYVSLTFSYTLDERTVDASSVHILDENNVPIAAVLRVSGETISIIPNEFFLPNMQYTIVVTTAVEDILGRTLENTFTYTFTTASLPDRTPPSLISITPADGIQVPPTIEIIMEFDENIAGDGVLQLEEEGAIPSIVNGTTTINNNTLRFVPEVDLVQGSNYTVTLQGTVEDLAGNAYTGLTSWNFSVTPENDLIAPLLLSVTPIDGAEVSKTTDIAMEFNEYIAGDGILQIEEAGDIPTLVEGTTAISESILRFVPEGDLIQGSHYTVTLQGTVKDLAGNAYTGLTSWSFSVIPASDLKVLGVSYSGRTIRIEFSEDLNTSTVSESDFAINDGLITFDHLIILDDHTVKFVADSTINGDENISVSGTIEDIYGNSHNNGFDAIYTLGESL